MEDRIQVNGVWYVREDTYAAEQNTKPKSILHIEKDVYFYTENIAFFEDDNFCIQLHKDVKDKEVSYIEIQDKQKAKELNLDFDSKLCRHIWDVHDFLQGIVDMDSSVIDEVYDNLSKDGDQYLIEFMQAVVNNGGPEWADVFKKISKNGNK